MFLEISQNSQENTCARVSLLIKLQASSLQLYQIRDSNTGVSLWILWNFLEHLFYRTPMDDCFSLIINKNDKDKDKIKFKFFPYHFALKNVEAFIVFFAALQFIVLIHLWPIFPFYTPYKPMKMKGFLVFSEGIKW